MIADWKGVFVWKKILVKIEKDFDINDDGDILGIYNLNNSIKIEILFLLREKYNFRNLPRFLPLVLKVNNAHTVALKCYRNKIFPFSILNVHVRKFSIRSQEEFMTQQGFAIKKMARKIWEREIKVMIGSAW